jgi:hypothetical protein
VATSYPVSHIIKQQQKMTHHALGSLLVQLGALAEVTDRVEVDGVLGGRRPVAHGRPHDDFEAALIILGLCAVLEEIDEDFSLGRQLRSGTQYHCLPAHLAGAVEGELDGRADIPAETSAHIRPSYVHEESLHKVVRRGFEGSLDGTLGLLAGLDPDILHKLAGFS